MNEVHNPYTPPKAEVSYVATSADEDVPAKRPTAINIALFLIGIGIAITAFRTFGKLGRLDSLNYPGSLFVLAIGAMSILIDGISGIFVSRGRNWARIAVLVICILSLADMGARLYAVSMMSSQPFGEYWSLTSIGWMALPHLLSLATVILLFGPGRGWFRERDQSS